MIRVIVDRQAKDPAALTPWLLKLRAAALQNPGYLGGETLVNQEDPDNVLTVSTWRSLDDWLRWRDSEARLGLYAGIEILCEQLSVRRFSVAATE